MNGFKNHDIITSALIFILMAVSLLLIFSNTYNTTLAYEGAGSFTRQIAFFMVGWIIYFAIAYFDIEWLRQKSVLLLIYLVIIGMLVYLLFFVEEVNATQRWISFGFINIQPSEFAKIVLIIITAYFLSTENINIPEKFIKNRFIQSTIEFINKYDFSRYFLSLVSILPIIGLVFIQPAFGNSIILFLIWFLVFLSGIPFQKEIIFPGLILLFGSVFINQIAFLPGLDIAGFELITGIILLVIIGLSIKIFKINYRFIALALTLSLVIIPAGNFFFDNFVASYQKERIETFLQGPEKDPYGAGYQVTQSKIALGSGMIGGRGYLQGSQSALKVLDFAYTDFIFASLGEQFGFTGALFVLILYALLILRILMIAESIKDKFLSLIALGIAVMILLNVFINAGMNMGILPVTGVPLPLVSYGGSSVLVNMIGLGLVQSCYRGAKSVDLTQKLLVS